MRIVDASNRLSFDVEDFITHMEESMNHEEKHFRALVKAKLQMLEIMALSLRGFKP